jgi:hypothetical protein
MSDVLDETQAGWRPDPSGRYELRYWDGGWTNRVANSARGEPVVPAAVTPAPPAPSAPPAPPVPPARSAPSAPAEIVDPFAALRTPRGGNPAAPAAAVPPARTFPTRHDGSSGTAWDGPYQPPAPATPTPREGAATGIVARITGFVRSFWEQPESYHSPKAGVELPPHPKEAELAAPTNYGRAGLVMLAACGVAIGAYLPWISVHMDATAFERTGYQMGNASGFTLAAAAFAVAAMLGARHRIMGWVTMGLAVVVAGLVAMQLLDVHEQVMSLNRGATVEANVGLGLWIMLASAAIGLVAAFRLDAPAEMV